MIIRKLLCAALIFALQVTAPSAFAQAIAAPASSVDSSARAVVAITPVDTSQFATTTQLNNVASTANTAYNTAVTANNTASTAYSYGYNAYVNNGYNKPWGRYFANTCSSNYGCYVYFGPDGYMYSTLLGYTQYLGYTSGPEPIYIGKVSMASSGLTGYQEYYAQPSGWDYYGQPTGWYIRTQCYCYSTTGAGG